MPRGYEDYTLNTWFPLDSSVFTLKEDFACGLPVDGVVGENGWRAKGYGADPVLEQQDSSWPNIGVVVLGGGPAANSCMCLTYNTSVSFYSLGVNAGWDSVFVFAVGGLIPNMRARIGWVIANPGGPEPLWGAWLRLDKDASFGDTNFNFACKSSLGGVEVDYDTGVPADLVYHRLRIRSLEAGVILMSLDYAAEVSFGPVGCDVTVTLGQLPSNPAFIGGNTPAGVALLLADYCAVQVIGLAR